MTDTLIKHENFDSLAVYDIGVDLARRVNKTWKTADSYTRIDMKASWVKYWRARYDLRTLKYMTSDDYIIPPVKGKTREQVKKNLKDQFDERMAIVEEYERSIA